jgi:hypothetical protein
MYNVNKRSRDFRENDAKRYRENEWFYNDINSDKEYYNANHHEKYNGNRYKKYEVTEKKKKTEPCRNINCHYNSSHCTFAHNLAELRTLPCLADFCNRQDCKYFHHRKETFAQWVLRNKYDLVFKNRELSLKNDIEKNIKNITKDVDEFMAGIDFIPIKNIPKNVEKEHVKDISKNIEKEHVKDIPENNINLELKLKLEKYVLDIKEEFKDSNISADKIVCCAIELSREEYRPKKCLTVWCLNNVEKLGKKYCEECHGKIIKMASGI